ncbi:MAG: elongation factor P [Hyphomicrobiaceae bacterium]|jgi:elongation factor P
MEKVQATNVRPGMVVVFNGEPHRVLSFTHRTPGKGNAVVRAKMRNLRTGVQTENRWMSTESMEKLQVTGRSMQYLYKDSDSYVFMDNENYEQTSLSAELLENEAPWLTEGVEVTVQFIGEEISGIELPSIVEIEVVETVPAMKGATATASPKPATLANGVAIKIPQFVEQGEVVRVDPNEGRYLERASK